MVKLFSSYDRTFLSSSDRGKIDFRLDLSLPDRPDGQITRIMAAYACIPVLMLLCVGECARVSGLVRANTLVQPRGRWKVKTNDFCMDCHTVPYRACVNVKGGCLSYIVDLYRSNSTHQWRRISSTKESVRFPSRNNTSLQPSYLIYLELSHLSQFLF